MMKSYYNYAQNNKIQISNNKQYPMTKISNSKHSRTAEYTNDFVSDIGILNLLFIWNLVLVYWCFVIK